MQLPTPLGNNVLVEVLEDHADVSRNNENESQKRGRVVDFNLERYHLTASAAVEFAEDFVVEKSAQLDEMVKGRTIVYWEELANEGQTFEHGGKRYASVAWWRLIAEEISGGK